MCFKDHIHREMALSRLHRKLARKNIQRSEFDIGKEIKIILFLASLYMLVLIGSQYI